MATFRIHTHGRLHEWVAEEKGYFGDEGLTYEFGQTESFNAPAAVIKPADAAPMDFRRGAFESYEEGRSCEVSTACHWAINNAAAGKHGLMWGHAYSVCPSGIYVPPESPIRRPEDLRGVEIGVGYHSGSHFSAVQALQPILGLDDIKLRFVGWPTARMEQMLDRDVPAGNVFGIQLYLVEQQGFRKVADTTFMMGFLLSADADMDDVGKYFRALQRAQRDIDLEPEKYKHYYLKELPERFHSMVDAQLFGTGERIVFEPYTREAFETTHRWLREVNIFDDEQLGKGAYEEAVLA
jgi:NitT/TauT family transport system substrate-binding protein